VEEPGQENLGERLFSMTVDRHNTCPIQSAQFWFGVGGHLAGAVAPYFDPYKDGERQRRRMLSCCKQYLCNFPFGGGGSETGSRFKRWNRASSAATHYRGGRVDAAR